MNGRPRGPRQAATSPSRRPASARLPAPTAFRKIVKLSSFGSTVITENGRRSGGSAEASALIITYCPARAAAATSGWRKVRST